MRAISNLEASLRRGWSFTTPRTLSNTFNVASGSSVLVSHIVDTVVRLTHSKSPIQRIPGDPWLWNGYLGDITKARKLLGFRAQLEIDSGLQSLVDEYLRRTEDFLDQKIVSMCGNVSSTLALNQQLEKLDGCNVHIEFDVQGEYMNLLAPLNGSGGPWNLAQDMAHPTKEFIPVMLSVSTQSGKYLVQIRSIWGDLLLGVETALQPPEGQHRESSDYRRVDVEGLDETHVSSKYITDWEVRVKPDGTAARLVIPGTETHLVPPSVLGGRFALSSIAFKDSWPIRISPLCCPAPAPWPFSNDDRE